MKEKRIKLRDFSKLFLVPYLYKLRKNHHERENAEAWKKVFAFFPVTIKRDGKEEKIRFNLYETRTYEEVNEEDEMVTWVIRENRIPGSQEVHKETLYGISC